MSQHFSIPMASNRLCPPKKIAELDPSLSQTFHPSYSNLPAFSTASSSLLNCFPDATQSAIPGRSGLDPQGETQHGISCSSSLYSGTEFPSIWHSMSATSSSDLQEGVAAWPACNNATEGLYQQRSETALPTQQLGSCPAVFNGSLMSNGGWQPRTQPINQYGGSTHSMLSIDNVDALPSCSSNTPLANGSISRELRGSTSENVCGDLVSPPESSSASNLAHRGFVPEMEKTPTFSYGWTSQVSSSYDLAPPLGLSKEGITLQSVGLSTQQCFPDFSFDPGFAQRAVSSSVFGRRMNFEHAPQPWSSLEKTQTQTVGYQDDDYSTVKSLSRTFSCPPLRGGTIQNSTAAMSTPNDSGNMQNPNVQKQMPELSVIAAPHGHLSSKLAESKISRSISCPAPVGHFKKVQPEQQNEFIERTNEEPSSSPEMKREQRSRSQSEESIKKRKILVNVEPAEESVSAAVSTERKVKIPGTNERVKKCKRGDLNNEKDETNGKMEQSCISDVSKVSCRKQAKESNSKASQGAPQQDFIHVRARRGQATDSHSLAERVRREKISERMKVLQDLVPGCNKVLGKAVMLDEIINYVQSLQRQVEFLSMRLATVNPRMESISDNLFPNEMVYYHTLQTPMVAGSVGEICPQPATDTRQLEEQLILAAGGGRAGQDQLRAFGLNLSDLNNLLMQKPSCNAPFVSQDENSYIVPERGGSCRYDANCSLELSSFIP